MYGTFINRINAQGSSWSSDKSRSRPADILVDNWDRGLSAAFYVLVMSPLNPSLIVEAGTSSGVAAKVAEECMQA